MAAMCQRPSIMGWAMLRIGRPQASSPQPPPALAEKCTRIPPMGAYSPVALVPPSTQIFHLWASAPAGSFAHVIKVSAMTCVWYIVDLAGRHTVKSIASLSKLWMCQGSMRLQLQNQSASQKPCCISWMILLHACCNASRPEKARRLLYPLTMERLQKGIFLAFSECIAAHHL